MTQAYPHDSEVVPYLVAIIIGSWITFIVVVARLVGT